MSGQVRNYKNTISQVVNILGDENIAVDYLCKCIYSIGLGSNDYLNNYFMPNIYSTSRRYMPDQYADVLIQQYREQLVVNMNERDYQRKKNKFLPKIHAWVQEHGGGTLIPFSCVLERNLADMPADEAAKYCQEKELQRSKLGMIRERMCDWENGKRLKLRY